MNTLAAVIAVGIAAIGGGFSVFAAYDDSPGGTLLGAVLVLGAMALAVRATKRSKNPDVSTSQ